MTRAFVDITSYMIGIRCFSNYSDLKYDNCNFEIKDYGVGLVTINRPKALNALCDALFHDLKDIMTK